MVARLAQAEKCRAGFMRDSCMVVDLLSQAFDSLIGMVPHRSFGKSFAVGSRLPLLWSKFRDVVSPGKLENYQNKNPCPSRPRADPTNLIAIELGKPEIPIWPGGDASRAAVGSGYDKLFDGPQSWPGWCSGRCAASRISAQQAERPLASQPQPQQAATHQHQHQHTYQQPLAPRLLRSRLRR